jgi:hypothetical protein
MIVFHWSLPSHQCLHGSASSENYAQQSAARRMSQVERFTALMVVILPDFVQPSAKDEGRSPAVF